MHHNIPLPRGWNRRAKSAILHILALSHYTFTVMVARASNYRHRRTHLQAQIDGCVPSPVDFGVASPAVC